MNPTLIKLFDLSSKVAIVTGGAKGIGQGIAETIAAAGAHVVIGDSDIDQAQSSAAEIRGRGQLASAIELDVASEQSVKAAVVRVADELKRIDILINNAGIFPYQRLRELDAATWDRTVAVNLRGAFLSTRYAAEQMIAGGDGGRIINISTINTARTYVGMAHYDASKGGLNALTRASALEYAPFGITVNAIAPGAVKTPGSLAIRRQLGGGSVDSADAEFAKKIPLGRWAEPTDIGHGVLCFLGQAADYITGQIVYVDGGLMLGM